METKIYVRTEKAFSPKHVVNEDHYFVSEYKFMGDCAIKVLIVADGMGGLEDGDRASKCAVEACSISLYQELFKGYMERYAQGGFSISYYAGIVEAAVRKSITAANKAVCAGAEEYVRTGTTLSVAVIVNEYAIVANTGDSPVYYYCNAPREGEQKGFRLVSALHTKAEHEASMGQYERFSAQYYENDNQLTKNLGRYEELDEQDDVAVQVIGYLDQGDVLLAGSDGAFGHLQEQALNQLWESTQNYGFLPALFERARMDKDDDQTAVVCVIA